MLGDEIFESELEIILDKNGLPPRILNCPNCGQNMFRKGRNKYECLKCDSVTTLKLPRRKK
jgi:ribosomal protein S27AE